MNAIKWHEYKCVMGNRQTSVIDNHKTVMGNHQTGASCNRVYFVVGNRHVFCDGEPSDIYDG